MAELSGERPLASQRTIAIGVIAIGAAVFVRNYASHKFKRATVVPIQEKPSGVYVIAPHEYNRFDFSALQPNWVALPKFSPAPAGLDHTSVQEFVGPTACSECHPEILDSFVHTAHARTSRIASPQFVLGSFAADSSSVVKTSAEHLSFEMREADGKLYQNLCLDEAGTQYRLTSEIDVAFGSGKIAQTYGYWFGEQLYELPISYFGEEDRWINSPGYEDGTADFARPLQPRCLECHVTYVAWVPGTHNQYHPRTLIESVSCERCHGPGADHVRYHQQHPDATSAEAIANPSALSRARQIDVCAQCHSGAGKPLTPPFSFHAGDVLEKHLQLPTDSETEGGVHTANQVARMKLSKCYTESDTMTCITCHDLHQHERGRSKVFAQRCLQCHERNHCGASERVGEQLEQMCISCHLPKRRDDAVRMEAESGVRLPLLRDHFVRIVREDAERLLESTPSP